jgi:ligand-binding sensor domain-containing protein
MRSFLAASLIPSLCAAACWLMLTLPTVAFDFNKPVTEYTHTVWTHKDGLPSAFIYSIAQTQDGYLWLGTADGLVRFDGVRFVHWRSEMGHKVLLGAVHTVCAAADGGLWVGTASGMLGHIRGDGEVCDRADVLQLGGSVPTRINLSLLQVRKPQT